MSRPPLNHLLGGLGTLAQSGLARAAVQNLWVTVPIGLLTWMSIQKRRKAGTLSTMAVIGDLAPMVMVVGTLIVLNHTLEQREQAPPAKVSPIPVGTPISDAEFELQPQHPIMATTEPKLVPIQPSGAIPAATPVEDSSYG